MKLLTGSSIKKKITRNRLAFAAQHLIHTLLHFLQRTSKVPQVDNQRTLKCSLHFLKHKVYILRQKKGSSDNVYFFFFVLTA